MPKIEIIIACCCVLEIVDTKSPKPSVGKMYRKGQNVFTTDYYKIFTAIPDSSWTKPDIEQSNMILWHFFIILNQVK